MKNFHMGDVPWNITEEQIAKMFPHLKPEDRREAAGGFSRYLKVIAKVYDGLQDQGKLEEVLLRIQYEKRNRQITASQNVNGENDDTSNPTRDSNESTA